MRGSHWAITLSPTESEVTSGWKTANVGSLHPLRTQSQVCVWKGAGATRGGREAAQIFINLLHRFTLSCRCFRNELHLFSSLLDKELPNRNTAKFTLGTVVRAGSLILWNHFLGQWLDSSFNYNLTFLKSNKKKGNLFRNSNQTWHSSES